SKINKEHHSANGIGENEKLQGGISPPGSAPNSDEEEHWNENDLPEKIEQNQVEGSEDAYDSCFENEKERIVLRVSKGNLIPRPCRGQEAQKRGYHQEWKTDPVNSDLVVEPKGPCPGSTLGELEPRLTILENNQN